MGIHTGDSFCVAPMLTVKQEIIDRLQEYSYRILDAIGLTGGCNCQYAYNPKDDRIIVIEINPRTSRSSALASKATGFPIAAVSTRLAAGEVLSEIPYWRDGSLDKYTPSGDYVVVKFARWAFEKFQGIQDRLGTQMRAVGEVMSIGKNFKEAFQKAIRGLEIGRSGLGLVKKFEKMSREELIKALTTPNSERYFQIYEALKKGASVDEIVKHTAIGKYFIEQMLELVQTEQKLASCNFLNLPADLLKQAKQEGFSDKYLAQLFKVKESDIRKARKEAGIHAVYCKVPVSGVEHAEYYYSTYADVPDEVPVSSNPRKILLLGGGPSRIGQGIEFDYCACHSAFALRDEKYETIIINCNPETVSTDYDTSDKLYFEPLTVEDVLAVYEKEKPMGVICQFGGQTPLNIAQELKDNGVQILGTQPEGIRLAEDREYFRERMLALNIPQPKSGTATSVDAAVQLAGEIGYPVMVRPSFVLGGRGMAVIYDEAMLRDYAVNSLQVSPDYPMLIDRFLSHALECEVDALSDGENTFVATVMEHIELCGIHSGDSACVIPPVSIPQKHLDTICKYAGAIAKDFKVAGILNVQFAIFEDQVYIIEANPRASRTVPLVAKVTGVPLARIATGLTLGHSLNQYSDQLQVKCKGYYGVKEAVFPFNMFPEVDPILGPEMRSTGEVLGLAETFPLAYYKAQQAADAKLPLEGTVLVSISKRERPEFLSIVKALHELKFNIIATEGTAEFLAEHDVPCSIVNKIGEGRPDVSDLVKNNTFDLIFNTPNSGIAHIHNGSIRKLAIQHKIPYMTTAAAAKAAVAGIQAARKCKIPVKSLQEYQAGK